MFPRFSKAVILLSVHQNFLDALLKSPVFNLVGLGGRQRVSVPHKLLGDHDVSGPRTALSKVTAYGSQ